MTDVSTTGVVVIFRVKVSCITSLSSPVIVASPQTSFRVRSSRIHSVGEKWMRDERTPKDVCGEAMIIVN